MSNDLIIGRPRQSTQIISERGGGPDERKTIKEHGRDLFRYRLLTIAWLMFAIPALAGRYAVAGVVAVLLWQQVIVAYRKENYLSKKAQTRRIAFIVGVTGLVFLAVDYGALEHVWLPVWWGWKDGRMPLRVGRQPLRIDGMTVMTAWVGAGALLGALAVKVGGLKAKDALATLVGTTGLAFVTWCLVSRNLLNDGRLVVNPVVLWLPQWFIIVRMFLLIAPPMAWDNSFRFVSWRQILEIIAPTASSVPVQPIRPSGITAPRGAPIEYLDADVEPTDAAPRGETIRVDHVELPPAGAEPLAQDAVSGDPSVMTGGTRNGLGNFELPVDLFGETRREAERNLITLAQGILAERPEDRRPWSRPEWSGDGQPWTAAQWRRLNNWLVDYGLVYKVGPRHNDPHDWNAIGRHLLRTYLESRED